MAADLYAILRNLLLIALYLFLNICLNMVNKWILFYHGFSFPILLSIVHQVFTFFTLLPFVHTDGLKHHAQIVKDQWFGLCCVSAFFALGLGCNNYSLTLVPLSLNQLIRATIPVATVVGATIIERKPPHVKEILPLLMVVGGVLATLYEGHGSNKAQSSAGIVICIVGTASSGLMVSFMGRLLSNEINAWCLALYTSPVIALFLTPMFLAKELLAVIKQNATFSDIGILMLSCVNALAYNLVHSLVIRATSSTTTTVIGEMKIVLIMLFSSFLFREYEMWTAQMAIGAMFALFGFIVYSHARLSPSVKSDGQNSGTAGAVPSNSLQIWHLLTVYH